MDFVVVVAIRHQWRVSKELSRIANGEGKIEVSGIWQINASKVRIGRFRLSDCKPVRPPPLFGFVRLNQWIRHWYTAVVFS